MGSQGNALDMATVLGKRIINKPKRYVDCEMESLVDQGRSRRGGNLNGASGAIQKQNKPCRRETEGNGSDNDDVDSQSDQLDPSEIMENYINEYEERIENNSDGIQYLKENIGTVFKFLWQVLPLSTVQLVAERTKDVNSNDHQWVQDLSYQRLGSGGNTNAEKGKNEFVNIDKATGTATAGATAAPQTELNYATAAASTPNAPITNDLNKLIRDNLEDMHRKKNIIIAGMDEEYDDDLLIRDMLRVMGCGFLYHDINKRPTRLGMKNNNRPRALKVEMNNEEAVEVIMKCKKELRNRNEHFYRIYINRDLRKEEREKEIAQRKARNSRIFGEAAAGAGLNTEIPANLGGSLAQRTTPSSGQGGSSTHQSTPSNGQIEVAVTPINETGTDLPITEVNGEIEIEEGVVSRTMGDETDIANNRFGDGSVAAGELVDSTDGGGGSPQNPNQGNISNNDQVSTENGLGNGGGKPGTTQP